MKEKKVIFWKKKFSKKKFLLKKNVETLQITGSFSQVSMFFRSFFGKWGATDPAHDRVLPFSIHFRTVMKVSIFDLQPQYYPPPTSPSSARSCAQSQKTQKHPNTSKKCQPTIPQSVFTPITRRPGVKKVFSGPKNRNTPHKYPAQCQRSTFFFEKKRFFF